MTHTEAAVAEWRGRDAVDSEGDKIGSIDEIYMDAETGRPEWLAVKTGDVRLPYDKQQVKDAPTAEADGELSHEEEAALYSHYDLSYPGVGSDSETVGRDTSISSASRRRAMLWNRTAASPS